MNDMKAQIKRFRQANKLFYKAVKANVPVSHMDMFMAIYNSEEGLMKVEIAKILGVTPASTGRMVEIYTKEGLPGVKASGYDLLKHGHYDRSRPSGDVMLLTTKGRKLVEDYTKKLLGE